MAGIAINTAIRDRLYERRDAVDDLNPHPDFMFLNYPAQPYWGRMNAELGKKFPPTFLAASTGDPCVPVQSHLNFFQILSDLGTIADSEMHLYPEGEHGFALCQRHPFGAQRFRDDGACTWPERAQRFVLRKVLHRTPMRQLMLFSIPALSLLV